MSNFLKLIFVVTLFLFSIALLHIAAMTVGSKRVNTVKHSDLIVVFPGSPPDRIAVGHRLAQEGFAGSFAVINASLSKLNLEVKRRGLLTGVNLVAGGKSRSTFEDVYNTKRIIKENKFKSVLLVTSSYHIPRAYFLLKVFLFGSGVDVYVYSVPIDQDGKIDLATKTKLYFNEIVKLWGSTVEMSGYKVFGKLVLDMPAFWQVRQFLKRTFLFHL